MTRKRAKANATKEAEEVIALTAQLDGGSIVPAPVDALKPIVHPIIVIDFSNSVSHYSADHSVMAFNMPPQFCYLCQNGGEAIGCDECPRVMCLKHVPQIAAVPSATRQNLHFRCPSCHTLYYLGPANKHQMTPYYVSGYIYST